MEDAVLLSEDEVEEEGVRRDVITLKTAAVNVSQPLPECDPAYNISSSHLRVTSD